MAKILFANGCSWTAGNGISKDPLLNNDDGLVEDLKSSARFAWPAVLGEKLSYHVINSAVGAGSNERIIRTTLDFVMSHPPEEYKDLLVVVGWTSVERGEVYINNGEKAGWHTFNARQTFSDSHPFIPEHEIKTDVDKYQKIYLTHIYDRNVNMMNYYRGVFLLSNVLENLKIKYLFFNGVPAEPNGSAEDNKSYKREMKKFQNPGIITDITFTKFCAVKKLPLSPCIHPMIQAHSEWANFLFDRISTVYGTNI